VSSRASVSAFEKLFDIYGSHVVTSVNYGGSIEFLLSKDLEHSSTTSLESIITLLKKYSHLITMKLNGGDVKLYSTDPSIFFSESKGASLFSRWKNSLLTYGIPLTVTPTLSPISNSLRSNGRPQNQIQEVEKSLAYFQSNDYTADGPERILQSSINTCMDRKQSEVNDIKNCEANFETREKDCNARAAECKEIEIQIQTVTAEKRAIESEVFHVNTTLVTKTLENYSLTLKNGGLERNVELLNSMLSGVREQVKKEKERSSRLKSQLAAPPG